VFLLSTKTKATRSNWLFPSTAMAVSICHLYFRVRKIPSMHRIGRQCWNALMHGPSWKRSAAIWRADLVLCLDFSVHNSFQDFSNKWRPTIEKYYHMQHRTCQTSSLTPSVLHSTPSRTRWYTCTSLEYAW
jgi:hypothetical protein